MMIYPSGYWKRMAREALKQHWLTALLIALIVNLPSLLVQAIAAVTGNDLMTRVQDVIYGAVSASGTQLDMEKITAGMMEIRDASGIWVMQGLNIVAWLMTPCLTLGMVTWLLGRLRKQEDPGVTAVFSQVKRFFPAIGLRLYSAWRVFLWMLPGVALCVLAMLPLWLSDSSSRISVLSAANTSMGLYTAAIGATVVLGVIGALGFAMGDMFLVDTENSGPIRAAKASRAAARGKKGQIFMLYISFIFWYLLEMLVASLTLELFGSIVSLMVQMIASLAITVYLTCSVSAFYLGCQGEGSMEQGEEPAGDSEIEI